MNPLRLLSIITLLSFSGSMVNCGRQHTTNQMNQSQPASRGVQPLYQMMLEWAVLNQQLPGRTSKIAFPDRNLIKDVPVIRVSSENVPSDVKLSLPNKQIQILSEEGLQKLADETGDFLAFRFSELNLSDGSAELGLNLNWILPKNSQKGVLSGGGTRILFRFQDGTWTFQKQGGFWIP